MKRLLKIIVFFGLILGSQSSIVNSVQAQITHSDQGTVDQKADALLKRAAGQFGNVSFTVTATMLDSQKKETMKQTAQVLYCKGCYRVTVADQEVICDGKSVWQWNKGANEVSVSQVDNNDMNLMNPGHLLKNYNQSFRAKFIRTESDGMSIVDLQPRSAQPYHKIRLFVNEKNGQLSRMEVHKYDSSREIYAISAFKRVGTPASQFTFDPQQHPKVEVIDMR